MTPGTYRHLGGCTDNSCPTIWRDQLTDQVVVRGALVAGVDHAPGEQVVAVPREAFEQAAAAWMVGDQLPRQDQEA